MHIWNRTLLGIAFLNLFFIAQNLSVAFADVQSRLSDESGSLASIAEDTSSTFAPNSSAQQDDSAYHVQP